MQRQSDSTPSSSGTESSTSSYTDTPISAGSSPSETAVASAAAKSSQPPVGMIAGSVVGGCALAFIAMGLYLLRRRRSSDLQREVTLAQKDLEPFIQDVSLSSLRNGKDWY